MIQKDWRFGRLFVEIKLSGELWYVTSSVTGERKFSFLHAGFSEHPEYNGVRVWNVVFLWASLSWRVYKKG